jgi:hypothetical protein
VRSVWAWAATASAAWIVPPVTIPGGKPVTALPGLTPRLPLTVVGVLVLVTVEPPSTAKELSWPHAAAEVESSAANPKANALSLLSHILSPFQLWSLN